MLSIALPSHAPAAFHLTPRQVELNHLLAGPQRHTMLVGGSRSGKTFLICRALLIRALRADYSRHAVLRLRANSARSTIWLDTLPKVARTCFPGLILKDHRQDGYIALPNRSEIWIGGLDDRDRVEKILGMEFATLYFNEGSQIPYGSILVALTRLAQNVPDLQQRAYYDLNPVGKGHWSYRLFLEGVDPESRLALTDPEDYRYAFINPLDNAENLSPKYLKSLASMPERRRRRFYSGEYVEEIEGALWSVEILERARLQPSDVPTTLRRVIVAVDPSGTSGEDDTRSDDVGIVVVALGIDGNAYVLADLTCNLPPEGWGRRVVDAFTRYKADAVIAERNFGGDMVRYVIQTAANGLPVPTYMVSASRGKAIRAEPVSALYGAVSDDVATRSRVFHVWDESDPTANFAALEDEFLQFSTGGYQGTRSPNRADACVAEGSMVETDRGPVSIEKIRSGDRVLTRRGFRRVLDVRKTHDATEVITVVTTAGRFTATGDHLAWTEEHGWRRVDALVWGDIVCHLSNLLSPCSSTDRSTGETRPPKNVSCGSTIDALPALTAMQRFFTSTCGVTRTVVNRLVEVFSFITSMVIRLTTNRRTLSALLIVNTPSAIATSFELRGRPTSAKRSWSKRVSLRPSGIEAKKVVRGILTTLDRKSERLKILSAKNVGLIFSRFFPTLDFAQTHVAGLEPIDSTRVGTKNWRPARCVNLSSGVVSTRDLIVLSRPCARRDAVVFGETSTGWSRALGAERNFGRTFPAKDREPVRVSVIGSCVEEKKASVYDLMIEGEHEFFANGHLVHNCIWGLSHLALIDSSVALAPPIIVRRRLHSPDTEPAPRVEYPTSRTVTLDPSEYETLTDRRGW